jgi:DNA (cytosine-5)-methyltransferase 3A
MINSALVSAQQRKRCYWTNIPNVTQPEDRGILLKDVLESGIGWQDKSYCVTSSYDGAVIWNTLERNQRTMIAEPVKDTQYKSVMIVPEATKQGYVEINQGECVDLAQLNSKTRRGRKMSDKSNCVTTSPEFYQFVQPANTDAIKSTVRLGHIGKSDGQANRVYSVKGKSICLQSQSGGGGAKTGLYKIDLPDGDYYIRKLTPVECERLQTLPDDYTKGISNTQRYKCIGNGWTVSVITHILSGLKGIVEE